jgi:hypothetical protein
MKEVAKRRIPLPKAEHERLTLSPHNPAVKLPAKDFFPHLRWRLNVSRLCNAHQFGNEAVWIIDMLEHMGDDNILEALVLERQRVSVGHHHGPLIQHDIRALTAMVIVVNVAVTQNRRLLARPIAAADFEDPTVRADGEHRISPLQNAGEYFSFLVAE